MKTTLLKVTFASALIISALTSCEKDGGFAGRIGSDAIGIGKVKTSAPATKSEAIEETSEIALADGSVFTLKKSVEPYTEAPQTKADVKDADNLQSFTLFGYLDAADIESAPEASESDKANTNFIPETTVTKGSDGLWHTAQPYYWRNGITHHFWAQSGAPSMTTTENTASFRLAGGNDEDIIVAYSTKRWSEDMCNDHTGDKLDLRFEHAMSASRYKIGTIGYQQKEVTLNSKNEVISTNISDLPENQKDRVRIDEIKLIRLTHGKCEVSSGPSFTWSELSKNDGRTIVENETCFSAPQSNAALEIYFTDTYRTHSRSAVIPLGEVWKDGHLYNYTVNGSVTVPKLGEGAHINEGINLNFQGNEKRSEPVSTSIDVTYYKKIEITWEALPTTSGNQTYALVYFGTAPLQEKDLKDIGNNPEPWAASHKSNLLFMYDTFHYVTVNNFGTATIDGQPVQEGNDLKKALCSCTLTVPDGLTGTINLYFAYRGGSNNTGVTNWTIKNLNFKVTEYK